MAAREDGSPTPPARAPEATGGQADGARNEGCHTPSNESVQGPNDYSGVLPPPFHGDFTFWLPSSTSGHPSISPAYHLRRQPRVRSHPSLHPPTAEAPPPLTDEKAYPPRLSTPYPIWPQLRGLAAVLAFNGGQRADPFLLGRVIVVFVIDDAPVVLGPGFPPWQVDPVSERVIELLDARYRLVDKAERGGVTVVDGQEDIDNHAEDVDEDKVFGPRVKDEAVSGPQRKERTSFSRDIRSMPGRAGKARIERERLADSSLEMKLLIGAGKVMRMAVSLSHFKMKRSAHGESCTNSWVIAEASTLFGRVRTPS
ncbi:hypothetical protein BDK51DRAFT_49977 [Blyttiomyces helicus]|uniref:Uncharacterized protein n=1 Tax=Blyttiomyces helicus TaxID=388810 RepID=A0A4P9VUV2_9FUNG|nr:hypothetical protein BDK51DRAFT_49977 [Blyttiomyces helicus]|eukprot:RKO83389.1 hypothetical protein BDK51DRAFT_49977 [Blyttiomyces helicus]